MYYFFDHVCCFPLIPRSWSWIMSIEYESTYSEHIRHCNQMPEFADKLFSIFQCGSINTCFSLLSFFKMIVYTLFGIIQSKWTNLFCLILRMKYNKNSCLKRISTAKYWMIIVAGWLKFFEIQVISLLPIGSWICFPRCFHGLCFISCKTSQLLREVTYGTLGQTLH